MRSGHLACQLIVFGQFDFLNDKFLISLLNHPYSHYIALYTYYQYFLFYFIFSSNYPVKVYTTYFIYLKKSSSFLIADEISKIPEAYEAYEAYEA